MHVYWAQPEFTFTSPDGHKLQATPDLFAILNCWRSEGSVTISDINGMYVVISDIPGTLGIAMDTWDREVGNLRAWQRTAGAAVG